MSEPRGTPHFKESVEDVELSSALWRDREPSTIDWCLRLLSSPITSISSKEIISELAKEPNEVMLGFFLKTGRAGLGSFPMIHYNKVQSITGMVHKWQQGAWTGRQNHSKGKNDRHVFFASIKEPWSTS